MMNDDGSSRQRNRQKYRQRVSYEGIDGVLMGYG